VRFAGNFGLFGALRRHFFAQEFGVFPVVSQYSGIESKDIAGN
jgi:hypothetical protein